MNALKSRNFDRAAQCLSRRGRNLVMRLFPADLAKQLTGSQLGKVAMVLEATYLDGYKAGGGDTADTVNHCQVFRESLLDRIEV